MAVPSGNSVPLTGNPLIDGLVEGSKWQLGSDRTLTYSLQDFPGLGLWTSYPNLAGDVRSALDAWSNVANIHFVQIAATTDPFQSNADIALLLTGNLLEQSGAVAEGIFPDPQIANLILADSGLTRSDYRQPEGDIYLDNLFSGFNQTYLGGAAMELLLHEMGHALGLKHPHDDGANNRPTFSQLGIANLDNDAETVMSYNDSPDIGAPFGHTITPMPLDILAIQSIYGANTSYHTGDDTYVASSSYSFTIWDAGGTDTLDASSFSTPVTLDLHAGSVNHLGATVVGIAYNVTVENAKGGSGNDTITGNDANNRLDGGAGDDTFYGGAGADAFIGGAGFDTVTYAGDNPSFSTGLTIDLAGTRGTGTAAGDTFSGIEKVIGTQGDDTLFGDAGNNWFVSNGGHDTFVADPGADRYEAQTTIPNAVVDYSGSSAGISVNLGTGVNHGGFAEGDVLIGISNVIGSAFDDVLAGAGNDTLKGGDGNDTLVNSGTDFLFGGRGNDIYIGARHDGGTINENPGEGIDEVRTVDNLYILGPNLENLTYTGTGSFIGFGNTLANVITGGAGDDTLQGAGGGDMFIGGAGFDAVAYDRQFALDMQTGGISGEATGDHFVGIEEIVGSFFDDTILGDGGDNTFEGSGGNDVIDGRGGNDTAIYSGSARDYQVTVDGDTTTVTALRSSVANADGAQDTLRNIETIKFASRSTNTLPTPFLLTSLGYQPGTTRSLASILEFSGGNPLRDLDGDVVLKYEVRDPAQGGAILSVGGVQQSVGTVLTVDTSAPVDVGVTTTGSRNSIEVRGFDGVDWSPWTTLVFADSNIAPVITGATNFTALTGTVLNIGSAFTITDPDGDPIGPITLYDFSSDPASGHFELDGVAQTSQNGFSVALSDLSRVTFRVGTVGDTLEILAGDGLAASSLNLTVTPRANHAPVVTGGTDQHLARGSVVSAASLFSVSDADGDPIVSYTFQDGTTDANSGHFELNGVPQPIGANFTISATDLANLTFRVGTRFYDWLYVTASDGAASSDLHAFTVVPPNQAPVVTVKDISTNKATLSGASLFTASDPDGDSIPRYIFLDLNSSANSGWFELNGVRQDAGHELVVQAGDIDKLQFHVGTTADQIQLFAVDWNNNSDARNFTITPQANRPPTVTAASLSLGKNQSTTLSAASLFTYADPDGDAIVDVQFWDGNSDASSGGFYINGVRQASGVAIDVPVAQLANTTFQAGTGTDQLWVKVSDGLLASAWVPFTITGPVDHAPVVTAASKTLGKNVTVAASSLFSASDADGDAITRYRFLDNTADAGSGSFLVNGAVQAAGQVVDIAANQLGTVSFKSGVGGDSLTISAFDSIAWGAPVTFSIIAPVNHAPTVTAPNVALSRNQSSTLAASSLFSFTDPDGDPLAEVQFWDGNADPTSGGFYINGVRQAAGQAIHVSATQLASTTFQAGAGTDNMWVMVSDGALTTAWTPFSVTGPVDHAPIVTASSKTLGKNVTVAASSLFSASDADGDAITAYRFLDNTADAGSGSFLVNGIAQTAGQVIDIAANQLGTVSFKSGVGGDSLTISAFDGIAWSAPATFSIIAPVNHAPTVTAPNVALSRNQSTTLVAASLFTLNDPDGDPLAEVQFWDGNADPSSGGFYINGVRQAAGGAIHVSAAQLANTTFQAGAGTDNLWVMVSDGALTSAWTPFSITGPVDHAPVVIAASKTLGKNVTVAASSLFSVSDADGDAITRYRFLDNTPDAGSGSFLVNGVAQAAGQVIDIDANQLGTVSFKSGVGGDSLTISAFDGIAWSAPVTISIIAPVNHAPAVTAPTIALSRNQSTTLAASSLFTFTDPDGDPIAEVQFWDGNADPSSGGFYINGVRQAAGGAIHVSAAQLANTTFQAGAGTDNLWVMASDGALTTAWIPFSITGPVDHAPVVTASSKTLGKNVTVAASSLFSVSDSDGDAITRYRFLDNTADVGSGSFLVNGVAQTAGQVIDIDANQLGTVSFKSGVGGDSLTISAFDGIAWSTPATFSIIAPVNHAPTVTAANRSLGRNDSTTLAASSLFTLNDPDGDPLAEVQFWDGNADPSSGGFYINGVRQAAGGAIHVSAAQLANTTFQAGTGTDNLWVMVSDGAATSAWTPFSITGPVDHAPVVTATNTSFLKHSAMLATNLFAVSDADGDTITRYRFLDNTATATSGFFTLQGVAQPAGQLIDITAAQLANLGFQAGTTGDSLSVSAFDGIAWSAPTTINVSIVANRAPVVIADNLTAPLGQSIAASGLFWAVDPDGDDIATVEVWDDTADAASGHFVVNGAAQTAGHSIVLNAGNFAQTVFQTGTGVDHLWVRVSDGTASSAWLPFTVQAPANQVLAPGPTDHNLVVTASDQQVIQGTQLSADTLFQVTMPAAHGLAGYEFWDGNADGASGFFIIDGVSQTAGHAIDVATTQPHSIVFAAGSVTDPLFVRVTDGTSWSDWRNVTVDGFPDTTTGVIFTVINSNGNTPTVTTTDQSVQIGASVAATSLFSAADIPNIFGASPIPADSTWKFELFDGTAAPSSGHFEIGGVAQMAGRTIDLTGAQLAQTSFVAGSAPAIDNLFVRANDGNTWTDWKPFHVTTRADTPPVVTMAAATIATIGAADTAAQLFTASDADGDAITQYQLFQWSAAATGGHLVVGGVTRAINGELDLSAAELATLRYTPGSTSDLLEVRAFDGRAWSDWASAVLLDSGNDPHRLVIETGNSATLHDPNLTITGVDQVTISAGITWPGFSGSTTPSGGVVSLGGTATTIVTAGVSNNQHGVLVVGSS